MSENKVLLVEDLEVPVQMIGMSDAVGGKICATVVVVVFLLA